MSLKNVCKIHNFAFKLASLLLYGVKKRTKLAITQKRKAFDTNHHNTLFKKVHQYRIKNNILQLIKSYLQKRSQCVSYNRQNSTTKHITCGVPQGSIWDHFSLYYIM